jgi:hypothetical protein
MDFCSYMAQVEDDDLEMQLLLSGPANEADLYELLGGSSGRPEYCTMTKLLFISTFFLSSSALI